MRQKLSSLSFGKRSTVRLGLHSVKEMMAILEQERARADRNDHKFSVILFDVDSKEENFPFVQQLAQTLTQRVRFVDEVGWLHERGMAVILPHTGTSGARCLVDDFSNSQATKSRLPKCTVFTYPYAETGASAGYAGRLCQDSMTDLDGIFYGMSKSTRGGGENGADHLQHRSAGRSMKKGVQTRGIAFWKRGIDIVGSLVALIIFSPLILCISIVIKLVSSGPVIFKQERLGYRGKPFTFWKFRTMKPDVEETPHRKHLRQLIHSNAPMVKLDAEHDTRIIPFGRFLRQTCLDELPQLFNVLKGEMSLVGPRPCLAYEAEQYKLWQAKRFDTMPGMTGLWQVSGKNGTSFRDMMRLDIRYAQTFSFWLDVKILLMTVVVMFNGIRVSLSNEINSRQWS